MDEAKRFLLASLEHEADAANKRAARLRLLADYVAGGREDKIRLASATCHRTAYVGETPPTVGQPVVPTFAVELMFGGNGICRPKESNTVVEFVVIRFPFGSSSVVP